jgi:hypothetical protein
MYSTGTFASDGGGNGRGTKDERMARRGARRCAAGWTGLRFERWELSSERQPPSASLIAGASSGKTQLTWRASNIEQLFVLFELASRCEASSGTVRGTLVWKAGSGGGERLASQ